VIDVRATVLAGLVAAIASTLAQLALWAVFTDALPGILWRDSRLAAAIVMGARALESAGFDLAIAGIATVVHFALSIAYALILAPLVGRRIRLTVAAAIGAMFGAALYAVNMHGFTAIYPWFAATRDPITFAAHVAFGASAALAYRIAAARRA